MRWLLCTLPETFISLLQVFLYLSTRPLQFLASFWLGGRIRASHQRLLESVLFADIRFHDIVSRGRLLNRFGTDFECWFYPIFGFKVTHADCLLGIDNKLSDDFGQTIEYGLSVITTVITLGYIGRPPIVHYIKL
jgi:hypothetical protein